MPFVQVNLDDELRELNALLDSDPMLRRKFEADQKEYEFRLALARARKAKNMTQRKIRDASGLTQQAISRIERGRKAEAPH